MLRRAVSVGAGLALSVGLLGSSAANPRPLPFPVVEVVADPRPLPLTAIEVVGDGQCRSDVESALTLLREKDPADYAMVLGAVGIIECVRKGSGMAAYENPPRFRLGDASRRTSVTWLAGTIVHDGAHASLYQWYTTANAGAVPAEAWTGEQAEATCLNAQARSLEAIGAPQNEITAVQGALQTQYWEIPQSQRTW